MANFTTFYLAVTCIVFNLNRSTPPEPVWDVVWWKFWLWVFVLPMGLLHLICHFWSEKKVKVPDYGDAQDVVDEEEEGGGA